MNPFREFEVHVLRLLVEPAIGAELVDALVRDAELVEYEYAGGGYFLTVRHPILPAGRMVLSEPSIVGRAGDVAGGFVAFIDQGELMLECHTWGPVEVPENFRDQPVHIEVR